MGHLLYKFEIIFPQRYKNNVLNFKFDESTTNTYVGTSLKITLENLKDLTVNANSVELNLKRLYFKSRWMIFIYLSLSKE